MKDLILSILSIFSYAGKILGHIRNAIFNTVLISIVVLVLFALFSDNEEKLPQKAILRLDISGNIVEERKVLSAFEEMLDSSLDPDGREPETLLQDVLDTIDTASQDTRVLALLLNLKHMGRAGLDQMKEIGLALEKFKASGKKVIAAEDYYTQSQYYLASYADRIFIHAMGGVDLHGFGVYRLYFQEALAKLQVNYNIFKVGDYKSALEPFTRNSMSPEDREQNERWLSALWNIFTEDIARQRNISWEVLAQYTNEIDQQLQTTLGDTAKLALNLGLVDEIVSREDIAAHLSKIIDKPFKRSDMVSSSMYLDYIDHSYEKRHTKEPRVGLIVAEGNILPGKQPPGVIGGDSLAALIKEARKDKQVKALVLRINSPGGSAFASEIIRQELLEVKKEGKPVIISMGSIAASGGYWIAANADEIWASSATITGSIGIFGAIPTFEKTLASIGVYSDGTGTTPLAAGLDISQALPPQLKSAMQQTINHSYNSFIQIVATGRNLDLKKVHEMAQGRVYDGDTAQQLGLVDKIGSLEQAISSAAHLAQLDNYRTELIRPSTTVRDRLLKFLTSSMKYISQPFNTELAGYLKHFQLTTKKLENLLGLEDPRGIYALCPFHFEI